MHYLVKKGDSLWRITMRELGDSGRWQEIAAINRLTSPYLLFVGQSLTLPPRQSVRTPAECQRSLPLETPVKPNENLGPATSEMKKVLAAVDQDPNLRGAAVVLQFPAGQTYQLRESKHASGLETVVLAKIEMAEPADEPSWWERWNGVVLNCGGMAISWGALALASAAEVPSVGTATPLVVLAYAGATATTFQCHLAIRKETSSDFAEYVESEDGQWIDFVDIVLDVISFTGGVTGAIKAVKSGAKLATTSKYAKLLNAERKGKLLKTLQRIEKHEQDLTYFRQALQKLIEAKKVADSVGRGISNNLLKRAIPYMTQSLKQETMANIGDVIAGAAATVSSYYGGVGGRNLGLVKVTLAVLQERIDRSP